MMRKKGFVFCLLVILAFALTSGAGQADTKDKRKLTLMIYMCGSNLESGYGSASNDIQEMTKNRPGSDNVTVLVMTGGSSRWEMGFDAGKTQIHEIGKRGMRTVWPAEGETSQALNMGDPETLVTFLKYGQENYPADGYALILWNHGGGPMAGICWDEVYSMDNLSVGDVVHALKRAGFDSGNRLEWIGFDACLMSSLEVACMMEPYARYMIASQETEPSMGWNYSFLKDLGKDADGGKTGRKIADAYFKAANGKGDDLTISCIDLSQVASLRQSLDELFSPLAGQLSEDSFRDASVTRMRALGFGKSFYGDDSSAYDLVDLGDLIRHIDSDQSETALAELEKAVIYNRTNMDGASGLSVYFPYQNKENYTTAWHDSYLLIESSTGYADYIFRFGSLLTADDRTDWAGLKARVEGEHPQGSGYIYACSLTEEQAAAFVSGRLLVLQPHPNNNGINDSYALIGDYPVELGDDHVLRATYNGQLLYAVETQGKTDYLVGPLSYHLLDDRTTGVLPGILQPRDSGTMQNVEYSVMMFDLPKSGKSAQVKRVAMYDQATGTYSSRIGYEKDRYSVINIPSFQQAVPPNNDNGTLPGFRNWPDYEGRVYWNGVDNTAKWRLQFYGQDISTEKLFVVFEVTDAQQNSYCSTMIPVTNPSMTAVGVTTGAQETDQYRAELSVELNHSKVDKGVNLEFTVTNKMKEENEFRIKDVMLNGSRLIFGNAHVKLKPGETKRMNITASSLQLTGMTELAWLKATITMTSEVNYKNSSEEEISFRLEPVDISSISEKYPLLAVTELNDVTWRLLNVELDDEGNLDLLIHVINNADQSLKLDLISSMVAVNGVQSHTNSSFEVLPHCDRIAVLGYKNEIDLTWTDKLEVQDEINMVRHGVMSSQLLLRHGFKTVESITFNYERGTKHETTAMQLKAPVSIPNFKPKNQNSRWYGPVKNVKPEKTTLLTIMDVPEACIRVERVLVCDNGLAAAIEIENRTDKNISFTIQPFAINGIKTASAKAQSYSVMPGCTLCDVLPALFDQDEVSEMTLRISGLRSSEIKLTFSSPAQLGKKGGTVLESNKMEPEILSGP